MIEPMMFLGLGFLSASLIALIIVPLVHARAVRLTTRRVEASAPVSIAEIQADKDQLRAEFAMATRRLEMSVEQLRSKATGQLSELGKKTEVVSALKSELSEKTAALTALQIREKVLQDQLLTSDEDRGLKTNALRETERKLADRESELAKVSMALEERLVTSDSQRIELVALKTQVATLRDQVSDLEQQLKSTEVRLERERADAEKNVVELTEARSNLTDLDTRISHYERQVAAQSAEAEMLTSRVNELENQLTEQARRLTDMTRDHDQLRAELDTALGVEKALRKELAALDAEREEHARIQREMVALKRETETTWENERLENALLRERINDVSAEVARMTAALEGPGSAIETILAADAIGSGRNGKNGQNGGGISVSNGPGTLADRIRALQGRARATSAG